MQNDNIASLGYGLEMTKDVSRIEPLLRACNLAMHKEETDTTYLVATTPAGGVAAAVGWSRYEGNSAVVHSLAVAPSSRGSGIGASQLASAMLYLREELKMDSLYLVAEGAVGFFAGFGFVEANSADLPGSLAGHSMMQNRKGRLMARRYGEPRHGLDNCAFCLIHNTTPEATLPVGSVFWFRQCGAVLEAQYRGGPVVRGHLLGARDGQALRFVWQHCTEDGRLMRGRGEIFVKLLDDGRRELREKLGDHPGELLLREL